MVRWSHRPEHASEEERPPHERTMPGHPPGSLSTMRNRRAF
nr:MAG TPA: hypothetical protein [Caudoviricetes sp.]